MCRACFELFVTGSTLRIKFILTVIMITTGMTRILITTILLVSPKDMEFT